MLYIIRINKLSNLDFIRTRLKCFDIKLFLKSLIFIADLLSLSEKRIATIIPFFIIISFACGRFGWIFGGAYKH